MFYILTLLVIALLVILGLVSTTFGAAPAALQPVQKAVKPGADAVRGLAGGLGVAAVILGGWGVLNFILMIEAIRLSPVGFLLDLLVFLTLIVVGVLAAYPSVAAFFGAPGSGAGRIIDKIKRGFAPHEAIVGLVSLGFGLWKLVQFILRLSGVNI